MWQGNAWYGGGRQARNGAPRRRRDRMGLVRQAWHGMVWRGGVRCRRAGMMRHGMAVHGRVWHGEAGKAWSGKAASGKAWLELAGGVRWHKIMTSRDFYD